MLIYWSESHVEMSKNKAERDQTRMILIIKLFDLKTVMQHAEGLLSLFLLQMLDNAAWQELHLSSDIVDIDCNQSHPQVEHRL